MTAVIPTTSVEVPELGTVDEERLQSLKADQLRATLKVLGIHPPAHARKPMLLEWAVNGLRLQALAAANAPVAAIEAPPAPMPIPDDAAVARRPGEVIPSASKWAQILAISAFLADSNLTPEALKKKPNDIAAILLRANDLGIPLTSALEQLYVIKGKVGMESKLMRALARRDGHHIWDDPESDRFSAAVHGERADNGDKATGFFTLEDARDQNLIRDYTVTHDENGEMTVTVAQAEGKPQWVKDTANMLKQRATARLCRDLFSDCLAGVSYIPDELGYIDVEEAAPRGRAGEDEPTMTLNQQRGELAARIEDLSDDGKTELRELWKQRNLPKPASLTPAGIRTARSLLEPIEAREQAAQAEADAKIDDAEVVTDVGSDADEHGTTPVDGETRTSDAGEDPLAAASSAPPDADRTFCIGCGEEITGEVVWAPVGIDPDEAEMPWHAECMLERPM